MLERIIIGLAAELVIKLVERYATDAKFRSAVDQGILAIQQASTVEEKQNASRAIQAAMRG